jgi:hypothetical protein
MDNQGEMSPFVGASNDDLCRVRCAEYSDRHRYGTGTQLLTRLARHVPQQRLAVHGLVGMSTAVLVTAAFGTMGLTAARMLGFAYRCVPQLKPLRTCSVIRSKRCRHMGEMATELAPRIFPNNRDLIVEFHLARFHTRFL